MIKLIVDIAKLIKSITSTVLLLAFVYFMIRDLLTKNLTQETIMLFMVVVVSNVVDHEIKK